MYKWRGHRYEPPQVFLDEKRLAHPRQPALLLGRGEMDVPDQLSSARRSRPDALRPAEHHEVPAWRRAGTPSRPSGTPDASRTDRDLGTIWRRRRRRRAARRSGTAGRDRLSYVTGSHHFKAGGNWAWGRQRTFSESHADLQQEYRSGVPDSVLIRNSPISSADAKMIADAAIFAQDSWTHKRLTVTGGLRYEYFDAMIPEQYSPAGRFVGERRFAAIEHVPQFSNLVAAAGGRLRPVRQRQDRDQGQLQQVRRSADAEPDDAVQSAGRGHRSRRVARSQQGRYRAGRVGCVYLTPGCEMQLSALPQNFGTRALSIQDPDLERPSNIETSIAVQHELMPGLSVGAGYYRRTFQNLLQTDFVDRSQADYSPVTDRQPARSAK